MYGSQLIPVETHRNNKFVLGVSDSKSTFKVHSDFTPQPTPPTSNVPMSSNVMMSLPPMMLLTSEKASMPKPSKNGTSV